MSSQRDLNGRVKGNDHSLKHLPADVLLKARSTLVSLSGVLKNKQQEQQKTKYLKAESKDRSKMKKERLKNSKSEPEFNEMQKTRHKSRIDEKSARDYNIRQRPLSVGSRQRLEYEDDNSFRSDSYSKESLSNIERYNSSEEVLVRSRLIIPVSNDRLGSNEVHETSDVIRPRKKLSFREPEIVNGSSVTMGRSSKHMGINSLSRRPHRFSLPPDGKTSKSDGIDLDLESQAMRIVRTVGQAFEVCHKLSINQEPEASTSSAIDEGSAAAVSKETASEVGTASGSGVSARPPVDEKASVNKEAKPQQLKALPPPPKTDRKRSPLNIPEAQLIDLFDLPEIVTKVEDVPTVDCSSSGSSAPLSSQHQLKFLRERLNQQSQHTRAAVAQLLLMRNQLIAEHAARCEAQARTHQLLVHNKELLDHISALVTHLQDRESGSPNVQPISAKHLTLLPQNIAAVEKIRQLLESDELNANQPMDNDTFFELMAQSKAVENITNNNIDAVSFDDLTDEQIQNYLIGKFENLDVKTDPNSNKTTKIPEFYQNCNAFPDIAPLENDLAESPGKNNNEFNDDIRNFCISPSDSSDSSSESSSDEGVSFIMPLSHSTTLKATGEDGRVRLIVPVSPSNSVSNVVQTHTPTQDKSGHTLRVPDNDRAATQQGTITRTTSEKVPNRSEMMTAMRSQWTRHTTK